MRVIGIDPGYDRMGVAVLDKKDGKEILIYSECLKTEKKLPFPERLFLLGQQIDKLIQNYQPQFIAIEKIFISKNQKTAMAISEIKGMLIYLAKLNEVKVFEYTPMEIKLTVTGYGNAKKDQVIEMVKLITKTEKNNILDDEFDAIAIGLTFLARERVYPQTKP